MIEVYDGSGEKPGIDVSIAVIKKYTLLTLRNWMIKLFGRNVKLAWLCKKELTSCIWLSKFGLCKRRCSHEECWVTWLYQSLHAAMSDSSHPHL
jgi:hypothetical protein